MLDKPVDHKKPAEVHKELKDAAKKGAVKTQMHLVGPSNED